MESSFALNQNKLVRHLNKPQSMFTKADIIEYVIDNEVEMINFMYAAGDGRLKTLNFIINDLDYIETILTQGERVDGSSLFDYIDPANSDLYVVPLFNTAFVDPFAEIKTVTMLCDFFDKNGEPLEISPRNTLRKACNEFEKTTGMRFHAMGELEYYVIKTDDNLFPATDQKGYHESSPFAKFNEFRTKCMRDIASTGGRVKYGHSEVGNFSVGNMIYEQNEIEFLPVEALDAADQLMLAKWIIRTRAAKEDYIVTFAPKITTGKAGSGLHIHMQFVKDGHNMMLSDGKLSDQALKGIAGMMTMAKSLTAFGNMVPTSYFRLVPNQEAPTSICWGDRNRSVLVRVPLGWTSGANMCHAANPLEKDNPIDATSKQTVELRSGDCSADIYLYLAALAIACQQGWVMTDSKAIAEKTYVDVDIHRSENENIEHALDHLPKNCSESADALESRRLIYEKDGIFNPRVIDGVISRLKSYNDSLLSEEVKADPDLMQRIVNRYFHCG